MKVILCSICLLSLGVLSGLSGAEPSSELGQDSAKRLIADMLEISVTSIQVATVIKGAKGSDNEFQEQEVRRVTTVHPVAENGKMVRRVRCYDFSWSAEYGWFYMEIRNSRSGEEVWIWSEKEGKKIVK